MHPWGHLRLAYPSYTHHTKCAQPQTPEACIHIDHSHVSGICLGSSMYIIIISQSHATDIALLHTEPSKQLGCYSE